MHGPGDGASRPRRPANVVGRARRPGLPALGGHRPRRTLDAADAPRPVASRSQRRDLQLPRAARRAAGLGPRVRTEGDAEVLLHAWAEWEEDALERFNGMFAFAIWNDERRSSLASDPFGEKPLYWARRRRATRFRLGYEGGASRPAVTSALRRRGAAAYLRAALMPPIDRATSPVSTGCPARTCSVGRTGEAEVAATGASSRRGASRYEDAAERLRELLLTRSAGVFAPTSRSARR